MGNGLNPKINRQETLFDKQFDKSKTVVELLAMNRLPVLRSLLVVRSMQFDFSSTKPKGRV